MSTIGVLAGDSAFADALLGEVNRRAGDGTAVRLNLGAQAMGEAVPSRVVIDRGAHRAPFLRSALKRIALEGAHVINDPFWGVAEDRFSAGQMVARAGVPVARMAILPNRTHVEGVVPDSLRNRADPLDWDAAATELGWPLVWKPITPGAGREAAILWSASDVLTLWEASGTAQYLLQEHVPGPWIRVLVAGGEVLPLPWDHLQGRIGAQKFEDAAADRAAGHALVAAQILGRSLGAFDFAVGHGEPIAVDLVQPYPSFEPDILGTEGFSWAVDRSARLALDLARHGPKSRYRWDAHRTSPTHP